MDIPEGLYPGPEVDGQPTWFARWGDVPDDYEWRSCNEGSAWRPGNMTCGPPCGQFVQVRSAPIPRELDPDYLAVFVTDGHRKHWVVWVAEMLDRTDLDQWEYASTGSIGWRTCAEGAYRTGVLPDDFPIIVRRRT